MMLYGLNFHYLFNCQLNINHNDLRSTITSPCLILIQFEGIQPQKSLQISALFREKLTKGLWNIIRNSEP